MFGWGKTKAALLEQQLESMHSYARPRINTAHERCNAIELRTTVLESGKEFTGEAVTNLAVSLTGIAGRLDAHILEYEKDRDAMNSQIVRVTRQGAELTSQAARLTETSGQMFEWVSNLEKKIEDVLSRANSINEKLDTHIEQTIKGLGTLNVKLASHIEQTTKELLLYSKGVVTDSKSDRLLFREMEELRKDIAHIKDRIDPVERHVSETAPAAASEFGGEALVPVWEQITKIKILSEYPSGYWQHLVTFDQFLRICHRATVEGVDVLDKLIKSHPWPADDPDFAPSVIAYTPGKPIDFEKKNPRSAAEREELIVKSTDIAFSGETLIPEWERITGIKLLGDLPEYYWYRKHTFEQFHQLVKSQTCSKEQPESVVVTGSVTGIGGQTIGELAESPAGKLIRQFYKLPDDNEPITEEWVLSMGWARQGAGFIHVRLTTAPTLWFSEERAFWLIEYNPSFKLRTRRHFRMACEILGIELKEGT